MVERTSRKIGRQKMAILVAATSTAAGLSQLMTPSRADAANVTWGNTGVTWNVGANWIGGVAPANSAVTDGAIFQGAPVAQPVMSASTSIGSLDFQTSGWAFSGSTLTLGTGGGASGLQGINSTTSATGTITINNANFVLSASQIWTQSVNVDVTGNLLFNGTSTSRSLTLNGTGELVANGPVDLNSGTGAVPRIITVTGTGNMTINGVLKSTVNTGTFRADSTGIIRLTNPNNTHHNTGISAGILQIVADGSLGQAPGAPSAANISVTGSSTLQIANGQGNVTIDGNRGVFIGGSASTSRNFNFDTGDNTVNFSSPLTDQQTGTTTLVTGNLVKQGTGTLVLSSVNSLTGTVAFSAGTLLIANPAALGNAGSLRWGGGALASTAPLTVNNTSVLSSNSIITGSQTITFAGPLNYSGSTDRTERFSQDPGIVTQVNGGMLLSTDAPRAMTLSGTGVVAFNSPITETPTFPGTLRIGSTGTVILAGTNTYSGGTNIREGVLSVGNDGNLGAAAASISFGSSGTLLATSGTMFLTGPITAARDVLVFEDGGAIDTNGNAMSTTGTVTGPGTLTKQGAGVLTVAHVRTGGLNVNAGTVRIAVNGTDTGASSIGSLTIAGGPSAPTATFDLDDNDAIFTATPQAEIQSMITFARNGGLWNQPGITSSAAGAAVPKNKGLGVLSGAEFDSISPGAPFAGFTVNPTDVLVKFTWYGDTDFNGVVNFDDYNRTDGGFNNNRTGWLNGDFDANGVVNFDDYSLIDVAFNTQSGTLRNAMSYLDGSDRDDSKMTTPSLQLVVQHFNHFGDAYATGFLNLVPEPTSAIVISGLAALAASRRRRRRAK